MNPKDNSNSDRNNEPYADDDDQKSEYRDVIELKKYRDSKNYRQNYGEPSDILLREIYQMIVSGSHGTRPWSFFMVIKLHRWVKLVDLLRLHGATDVDAMNEVSPDLERQYSRMDV